MAGLTGPDTFTFVVSDGVRTSNVGTISVLVSAVDDPPVAFDASITATPGVPVSGTLRAIDPEGARFTVLRHVAAHAGCGGGESLER